MEAADIDEANNSSDDERMQMLKPQKKRTSGKKRKKASVAPQVNDDEGPLYNSVGGEVKKTKKKKKKDRKRRNKREETTASIDSSPDFEQVPIIRTAEPLKLNNDNDSKPSGTKKKKKTRRKQRFSNKVSVRTARHDDDAKMNETLSSTDDDDSFLVLLEDTPEQRDPSRWARSEAFFFNHGANIAFIAIMLAFNIGMAVWGAWQFVEPRFVTNSDILRITLPIARAAGRLVTWNAAVLLITGCKFFWTSLRQSSLAYGFPIDNIMPYYHRIVALTIIVMGCVVHTIPQIVNYATNALEIVGGHPLWGTGIHTLQLFVTGIILFFTFGAFFFTTLEKVRRTTNGFRLFWWTHVIGIVVVFPTLIIHGTVHGEPILLYFIALPMGLYISDSILRRFLVAKFDAKVVHLSTHEDGGESVIKLTVRNRNFKYKPGQYAELRIPAVTSHEWHPFTIASAPDESGNVTFYIKSVGRWTSALFALASEIAEDDGRPSISRVQIRGPFGAPAQNYSAYRHIVVIGSGIGVTPLLSVWKYLTRKDSGPDDEPRPTREHRSATMMALRQTCRLSPAAAEELLVQGGNVNHMDIAAFENHRPETWRAKSAYYASILESMTVSICLFVLLTMVETAVLCTWMFMFQTRPVAADMQAGMSGIALLVFLPKLFFSLNAYRMRYVKSFVFLLELCIVLLDLKLVTVIAVARNKEKEDVVPFVVAFCASLFLQMVRIFYTFYTTARPPMAGRNRRHSKKKRKKSSRRKGRKTSKELQAPFKSVTGIWVSKQYASMSFAASDLIDSVCGLSSKFSLQLYATRDKEIMHDPFAGTGTQHELRAGRPEWEPILTNILDNAHDLSEEGEAVGVFFCGSPAIALALQRAAQSVNAHHQFVTQGKCRCRVLVHKENF